MKTLRLPVIFAATVILLAGCTKDPVNNLSEEEMGIYITNHDGNADFSSYATFSLADSVVVISNNQLVDRTRTDYDAALISAFATELEQRGYMRVDNSAGPDLGITISRIYNDYSGVIDYTDYWDYYGGYWDPYYWGYPGYDYYFPPTYGVYTITDGAVTIDMFDVKNASGSNQLRQIWSGLIRGGGAFNPNRVDDHSRALLEQSPYLRSN